MELRSLATIIAAAMPLLLACGGTPASGGANGSGGGNGSGGTSASGGTSGSGGSSASGGTNGSGGTSGSGGSSASGGSPPPFELDRGWIYLGPSDGPHDLTIGHGSMEYKDVDGQWSSKWTIKSYDNEMHHFRVAFDSGSGTYLPDDQKISGTYDLTGNTLTIQLANGASSYPELKGAGSCTPEETGGTPVPDCRVYTKSFSN